MKVLVVDDSWFMRTFIKEMLQKHGHVVVGEAANGQDAVEKYMDTRPDIVIMDITMEGVDGIEGVKRIKAFDKEAKVIMCSGMGQQSYIRRAILAGAEDFIIKPIDEKRLLTSMQKIFEINNQEKEDLPQE